MTYRCALATSILEPAAFFISRPSLRPRAVHLHLTSSDRVRVSMTRSWQSTRCKAEPFGSPDEAAAPRCARHSPTSADAGSRLAPLTFRCLPFSCCFRSQFPPPPCRSTGRPTTIGDGDRL